MSSLRFLSNVLKLAPVRQYYPTQTNNILAIRQYLSTQAKISIALVKELRASSGAPINECKQALEAEGGDVKKAFEWLRKKGMAAASKKAGRSAREGLVAVKMDGPKGAIIEVNSETDFVARNEIFQAFVTNATATAFDQASDGASPITALSVDELLKAQVPGFGQTLGDSLMEVASTIREKIEIRRACVVSVPSGIVAGYIHGNIGPMMGSSAALVALAVPELQSNKQDSLQEMGKRLAMHVVAAKPKYTNPESIPEAELSAERSLLVEQAKKTGKPDNIIEKMVQGRLNKFYGEITLEYQPHMVEEESPVVRKFVSKFSKDYGSLISIADFARYQCGEDL